MHFDRECRNNPLVARLMREAMEALAEKAAPGRHKGTRLVIDFGRTHKVSRHPLCQKPRRRAGGLQRPPPEAADGTVEIRPGPGGLKGQRVGTGCFTGTERGISSQGPPCGHHQKSKGRVWRCRHCRFIGHRDLVGSVDMHPLALGKSVAFPALGSTPYRRPGQGSPDKRQPTKIPPGKSSRPGRGPPSFDGVAASKPGVRPTRHAEPRERRGQADGVRQKRSPWRE
jgi:hypothetical protein